MRLYRPLAALAIAALGLAGCASSSASPSVAPKTAEPSVVAATPTAAPAGLTIYYEENCQVELVAPSGRRVLIDVATPSSLSKPAAATDVLLSTHLHSDHYLQTFADAFPGKKITNEATELKLDDLKVVSIDASHDDSAIQTGADASNHIFVIDFDGFRIAHLGSTGQAKLTPAQLAAIGQVDIAFAVLQNVGGADDSGHKALDIVDQLKPRLLIPTHTALEQVQLAGAKWKGTYSTKPSVTIRKDQLPAETTMLFMGQLSTSYGAILSLPQSDW